MAENRRCPECAGEMERGHVGFDGQKVFWAGGGSVSGPFLRAYFESWSFKFNRIKPYRCLT